MINHNRQLSKRIKAPARDLCLLLDTVVRCPSWDLQPLYWWCQAHLQSDHLLPWPAACKGQKGTRRDTNPSWGRALGDGSGGWQRSRLCQDNVSCRRRTGRSQAVPGRGQLPREAVCPRGAGMSALKQVLHTPACSWPGSRCQEEAVSELLTGAK